MRLLTPKIQNELRYRVNMAQKWQGFKRNAAKQTCAQGTSKSASTSSATHWLQMHTPEKAQNCGKLPGETIWQTWTRVNWKLEKVRLVPWDKICHRKRERREEEDLYSLYQITNYVMSEWRTTSHKDSGVSETTRCWWLPSNVPPDHTGQKVTYNKVKGQEEPVADWVGPVFESQPWGAGPSLKVSWDHGRNLSL